MRTLCLASLIVGCAQPGQSAAPAKTAPRTATPDAAQAHAEHCKQLREHAYPPLPIAPATAGVTFDGQLYRAELVFARLEQVHRVHQWWAVDRANNVAYHFYEPLIGTPTSMSVLVRGHDMTDGVLEVDVVAILDWKPCMHARDLVPCTFEQGILW